MEQSDIVHSCYHNISRKGENFVPQHTLCLQLSGSFHLSDGNGVCIAREGDFYLIRKNQLVKFTKYPPENGIFESINIRLSESVLRDMAVDHQYHPAHTQHDAPLIRIPVTAVLHSYMQSIESIRKQPELLNTDFMDIKIRELLYILLQTQPSLKDVLFDFSVPYKIDLEAFMNQNYRYNVPLKRFAYLTGRSLATFKRDFHKIFQSSPHQWILKKRLLEAHYLISQQHRHPADIFIDLGFEDLSHFSYAFKKQFGYSPRNSISPGQKKREDLLTRRDS